MPTTPISHLEPGKFDRLDATFAELIECSANLYNLDADADRDAVDTFIRRNHK